MLTGGFVGGAKDFDARDQSFAAVQVGENTKEGFAALIMRHMNDDGLSSCLNGSRNGYAAFAVAGRRLFFARPQEFHGRPNLAVRLLNPDAVSDVHIVRCGQTSLQDFAQVRNQPVVKTREECRVLQERVHPRKGRWHGAVSKTDCGLAITKPQSAMSHLTPAASALAAPAAAFRASCPRSASPA